MKSSDDDIVWSDESLTIRDVVYQTMPTVVRVAEGFYSGNEAESFSRGDLLKLDFVKSIQKVYATIISSWSHAIIEDGTGYMQPDKEIVIPLGYKGKVVITRPPAECKVYFTVAELMCDFPRFVRVDKSFFVQSNENTAIQIEAGKKLELDRYLPTQGLIAKYENEIVVINNSIKSRFVPLPDDTEYTLIEVVDRLPLPQFVTFVADEFKKLVTTDLLEAVDNVQSFTGCVKLNRVFREEVVVGHHKPQIPECLKKEYGKYVRRSVVLLPLSRDAVNEIEVNVPVYLEPDDYAFLVASNFSQKSPNEDIIDGSLYLEFAKNPRSVYVIDEEEVPLYEEPEVPPPIPPRPKNHSEGGSNPKVTTPISASRPGEEQLKLSKYGSKPKITRPESEELDYEPVSERPTPPKIVPRSIQQNRETHKHNPSQKVEIETPQTAEELDGPLLIYEVSDDESDSYIGLTQSKPKRHIPKAFYKKLKSVQSELKARITSKGHSFKPHQLNITALVSQPISSPSDDVKSKPISSPISPTYIGKSKPILLPTRLAPIGKPKHIPSPTSPTSIGRSIPIKPHPLPTLPPPLPKPKHNKTQTKDRLKSKAKGQETSQSSYINTKLKAPRPKHTVAEKVQCNEKQTVKLDEKDKIDDDDDDEVTYDYPDISKMTNLPPPQSQGRPIVRVQPSTRVVPTTSTSVSQMSVKDLVLCLNQCALPELAKLCTENTIDGKFLSDLQDHDLRDKPYSLNIIEVAKVQKMKEGWRPKID